MNLPNNNYQEQDFDYQFDGERRATGKDKVQSHKRRMQYSRANRPAVSHNGMHRRRNKRFAW